MLHNPPSLADILYSNKNISPDLDFSLYDLHATTVFEENALQCAIKNLNALNMTREQFEYLLYNSDLSHLDSYGYSALYRAALAFEERNPRNIIRGEDILYLFNQGATMEDYTTIFRYKKVHKLFSAKEINNILATKIDYRQIIEKNIPPLGLLHYNFIIYVMSAQYITQKQLNYVIERSEFNLPVNQCIKQTPLSPFYNISNRNFNLIFNKVYKELGVYDSDIVITKLDNFYHVKAPDSPATPRNLRKNNLIYQWKKILNHMLSPAHEDKPHFKSIIQMLNSKPQYIEFVFSYLKKKSWFYSYIEEHYKKGELSAIYNSAEISLYREKQYLEKVLQKPLRNCEITKI